MGDPVTLKCRISGTPDISVAWFKADGKLRKSNTCSMDFTNGVATLKLIKTTKFDHSEYICKAENRVGSASTSCNVTVKGEARFPFFFLHYKSHCGCRDMLRSTYLFIENDSQQSTTGCRSDFTL